MNPPTRYAPYAACCIVVSPPEAALPRQHILFFRRSHYIAWDVEGDGIAAGFPREIEADWPGLLGAFPGKALCGALHVREWGRKIHFQFEGESRCATWDLAAGALLPHRPELTELLPGEPAREPGLVLAYAQAKDGQPVVYGFRGTQAARWRVLGDCAPAVQDTSYPQATRDGWPEGLTVAPDCAVFAHWMNRSDAHPNRKIYYFLGDVYLRWDVTSHTRNYRLDIPSGWKNWPRFD